MAKNIRDNEYYLERFQNEEPALYQDIMAKKTTVSAVRKLLGMGAERTRLHELKNAWDKASWKEQADFLTYAGLATAAPMVVTVTTLPSAGAGAFNSDGTLAEWGKKRVLEIKTKRKLKSGDVSAELGLSSFDHSVMYAIRQGTRIKSPTTATALEMWLTKNAKV